MVRGAREREMSPDEEMNDSQMNDAFSYAKIKHHRLTEANVADRAQEATNTLRDEFQEHVAKFFEAYDKVGEGQNAEYDGWAESLRTFAADLEIDIGANEPAELAGTPEA